MVWIVNGLPVVYFHVVFSFWLHTVDLLSLLQVSHLSEGSARRQFITKVNSVSSSFCVTLNESTARSFYFLNYQ